MSKLLTNPVWRGVAFRKSVLGMAVATALALPQVAAAMEFDLGSDTLSFRWDNTIRLNVADRVAGRNNDMAANPNYDDGDRNFDSGSIWTRFDLYSEADLVWKPSWGTLGARVSAQGWWDPGYRSLDNTSVATANNLKNGVPTLDLSGTSKRYNEGPSGEFMDWFLFGSFTVGQAPVNIKVGQTTVYYGESLFAFAHAIAYSQNPVDIVKALSTPGAEAKELYRPRVGFNVNSQVTDTLNVALQYFFNWQDFRNQSYRYPEDGSFLTLNDALLWGGKSIVYSPRGGGQWTRLWRGEDITPDENSGNYGLAVRWAPEWADATFGLYYRRTYDMQPQIMVTPDVLPGFTASLCGPAGLNGLYLGGGQCLQNPDFSNPNGNYANLAGKGRVGAYNLAYGKDIDIIGLSLSKNIGGLSLGAELSYRKDMPLLSDPVLVVPAPFIYAPAGPGGPQIPVDLTTKVPGSIGVDHLPKNDTPGAKGDTMHGLVNLVGILGESIWDTASWSTELSWMTYFNVSQNEAVFKGRSNHNQSPTLGPNGNCQPKAGVADSWCAYSLLDKVDKNYFGLAINFTPTWFQVRPGMDVLTPMSWSQGISGNSAITAGGQDGAGTFGLGVALDFYQRYRMDLKYVGFYGQYQSCGKAASQAPPVAACAGLPSSAAGVFNGTNAVLGDRDYIALTFKTTF
jgi:Protein of unknown function (DUF1302)